MKKWLLSLFLLLFTTNVYALKPDILLDNTIKDNIITLNLSIDNQTSNFKHQVVYDNTYLELYDIISNDGYQIEKTTKDNVIELTINSINANNNQYATIFFKTKDSFTIDTKTRIFLNNYQSDNETNKGIYLDITKDSKDSIIYLKRDITKWTDKEIWLEENIIRLVIYFLAIILVICILINIPKRRKKKH